MTAIVFSKDRPLQLDAFLRSWHRHVGDEAIHVLYRATTERHRIGYHEVFNASPWVQALQERTFKHDVLLLVPYTGHVLFFVDDQLFIRDWDGWTRPGLSLRLGLHLTSDYALGVAQPLPPYQVIDDELVTWRWQDGAASWRYPLALDGHVFEAHELRAMIQAMPFHSPNTLEAALQHYLPDFLPRFGLCYRASKVVNVPWNRVQTDCPNRCGTLFTADDFLATWEGGQRLNLAYYDGLLPESVHVELPLEVEPR